MCGCPCDWQFPFAIYISPSLLAFWGVTFARLAATLDLYSFWELLGQSDALVKSTLQPQSATTTATTCCYVLVLPYTLTPTKRRLWW